MTRGELIFPGFKKIQVSDGGDDEENFLISPAVFGFHLEHDIMSTIDRVKPVMKASSNVRQYCDFLWAMTEKEIKVRYKRAVFGFLWVIVNPLLQMIVIGFVFRFFIKEPIKNYYLYLLVGLLVWNFFSLSLAKATSSIVNERSLIKKARFPSEVIPLSIIISNLIHLMIAFCLLIPPILIAGTFSIFSFPKLFLAIMMLLVFTIGLSLLTSALNVRFRDISFFVQAVLIIWFYITPIVYSINVIPKSAMWIWRLNPLTSVIQLFQDSFASASSPGLGMFSINLFLIIIVALVGIMVFRRESKNFDDWL